MIGDVTGEQTGPLGPERRPVAPLTLLASLTACRSEEELYSRLHSALAGCPGAHLSSGPDWTLTWTDHPGAPDHAEFEILREGALNLRASLRALGRASRLSGLALQFAGRGQDAAVIQSALPEVIAAFSLRGVQGLRDQHGQLVPEPAWLAGTVQRQTWTAQDLQVVRRGAVTEYPDGLLLPLPGRWRARVALWLEAPGRSWSPEERSLLDLLARAIGTEHERVNDQRLLSALLAMQGRLLESDPESAYRPLLQEAVELIPGAQGGSLLVRDGAVFRYAAAISFDETDLRRITYTVDDTRDRWYGLGPDAWNRGVPRVLRDSRLRSQGSRFIEDGEPRVGSLPSVGQIAASIGVPILHEGEVYAFLNIDAHTDPDAFGEQSVEVTRSFAVQAALLLHENWQRARIQHAARTDVLTGLPNRRAFTEALDAEVANARRYGTALSLLLADVTRFKTINDSLGHAAGDQALVQVAEALRACLRAGDHVFRWGGDEFALLLPHTTLEGAQSARERIRTQLAGCVAGPLPLELNIGVAALPPGDDSGAKLLHDADTAMYREKQAARRP
ncbi:sensor domain-containing diguanylate cyclase [Deinococcus hohokamensis]|uniref:Diguanylate cyclase domain-containing protein n=1 Tax=Deinococcus hohokamensis TaxID=309883 RepID=A0ABV9I8J9_9DEIO